VGCNYSRKESLSLCQKGEKIKMIIFICGIMIGFIAGMYFVQILHDVSGEKK
jgi:hypothetical protein